MKESEIINGAITYAITIADHTTSILSSWRGTIQYGTSSMVVWYSHLFTVRSFCPRPHALSLPLWRVPPYRIPNIPKHRYRHAEHKAKKIFYFTPKATTARWQLGSDLCHAEAPGCSCNSQTHTGSFQYHTIPRRTSQKCRHLRRVKPGSHHLHYHYHHRRHEEY